MTDSWPRECEDCRSAGIAPPSQHTREFCPIYATQMHLAHAVDQAEWNNHLADFMDSEGVQFPDRHLPGKRWVKT